MQTIRLIAQIQLAAVPPLRVAFTIAVLVLAGAGFYIIRNRHRLLDRDPQVEDDIPAVENRAEEVIVVWGGLMLVLLAMVYQVWNA